jgi:hypothetical protein
MNVIKEIHKTNFKYETGGGNSYWDTSDKKRQVTTNDVPFLSLWQMERNE